MLADARKKLDDAFADFRKDLAKIHKALDKVDAAGPEDDVYELLEKLEDEVKNVRTGGLIGGGAKNLRKAREEFLKQKGQ
ncbi:MAG: hypothetical protein AB7L13_06425 [Acidimicrobiia bacterium]